MKEEKTLSDKIWSKIKDLPIEIYSIPAQKVQNHVNRIPASDNSVLLTLKSSGVLPSLEKAINTVKVNRKNLAISEHGQYFSIDIVE